MRIREDFDRFQGLDNEITEPVHVQEPEAPVEAAPVDHFEREEPTHEERAPRERREVHTEVERNEQREVFEERRADLRDDAEQAQMTLEALDFFDERGTRYAEARQRLREEREAAIAGDNALALADGQSRVPPTDMPPTDGEIDLSRIGTGLNPNAIPPQIYWDEEMVNHCVTDGQAAGGVTQEQIDEYGRLGHEVYAPENETPEINAGDLAVLVAEEGVDLTRVDPNQLVSATRYINDAEGAEQHAERLQKAIACFTVLTTTGAPPIDRELMKEKLWAVARVPGHAIEKMSTAELAATYQEVVAHVNGGAGKSEIKVGDHNLKITVDDQGQVTQSECKKKSFWSKVGTIARIVVSVLAIIPSPIQPFAAIASGIISAVRAARDKNWLGMIGAAASAFGAGFARFGAGMMSRGAQIANGVSAAARGAEQIRRGGFSNILAGAAGIVGGAAGIAGNGMSNMAETFQRLSTRLQPIGSIEQYQHASHAVSDAERSLDAARASGDPAAIQAAQAELDRARREQRSALFSGVSSFAAAAGTFSSQGSTFNRATNVLGRGADAARGINDHDYASALVSGLGAVDAARGPHDGFDWVHAASTVADSGNAYRLALNAERDADRAVHDAEAVLEAARRSGDPSAIADAERQLRDARRNRGGAIAGSYYAETDLGNALGSTVNQYRQTQRERAYEEEQRAAADEEQRQREEGAASLRADADVAVAELEGVLANERTTGGLADIAQDSIDNIHQLEDELDLAVASGDLDRIHHAADALEDARVEGLRRSQTLRDVLAPVQLEMPPLATELDLPDNVDYQIRPNDRLETIAQRNHLTVQDLLDANPGIDPLRLQIGQTINLPTSTSDQVGADQLESFYARRDRTPAAADAPSLGLDTSLPAFTDLGGGSMLDRLILADRTAREMRDRITSNNSWATPFGLVEEVAARSANRVVGFFGGETIPDDRFAVEGTRELAGLDGSLVTAQDNERQRRITATDAARHLAESALLTGWGNCQELAASVAIRLFDSGIRDVEIMGRDGDGGGSTSGSHAFVVIGRLPGSDPSNPATWGSNAIIVDGWDHGRAYQAGPNTLLTLPGTGAIRQRFRLLASDHSSINTSSRAPNADGQMSTTSSTRS